MAGRVTAVLTALLLFTTAQGAVEAQAETKKRSIRIGISSALTGEAAAYGLDVKDAILFAGKQFGGGRYEFVLEDDKCSGKDAVTVARKFIHVDKVDYVMGFACSGAALAAVPLYEAAKIPTIVVSASSPKIADAGDYIFRTTPDDRHAGKVLFDHVRRRHKRFAVLSEETEYCQDMERAFTAADSESELEIVSESFLPGTRDFKTLLVKLLNKSPEGLFINSQAERTMAVILRQARELHWEVPVYGAYWPGSPAFLKIAREQAEGMEFVDTPSLDHILTGSGRALLAKYRSEGGELRSIESLFASSVEGFRALDQAVRSGGDVRRFLYEGSFDGVFGSYGFDEQGEIEGLSFVIKRIRGGSPELLRP